MKIFATFAAVLLAAQAAWAQDIQERTLRWGHLQPKDHPVSAGTNKFAQIVEQKSGGRIKVKEFPNSALGSELQQQAALQGGTQRESLNVGSRSVFRSYRVEVESILEHLGMFERKVANLDSQVVHEVSTHVTVRIADPVRLNPIRREQESRVLNAARAKDRGARAYGGFRPFNAAHLDTE